MKFLVDNEVQRNNWVRSQLSALKPGTILDVGCGSQQYRKYCNHLDYKAQDFGKSTCGLGLESKIYEYGKLDYICNCWEIDEEGGSFDYVLCTEVLEHIPYPAETIVEINRLLKTGGKLIMTVPCNCLRHFDPYWYYSGFSDNWLNYFFGRNNFKIESMVTVGNYNSWLMVEIFRTIRKSKLSFPLLLPAFLYFFTKSKFPSKEDLHLLNMGYMLMATKI